jgi:hypothetical protein
MISDSFWLLIASFPPHGQRHHRLRQENDRSSLRFPEPPDLDWPGILGLLMPDLVPLWLALNYTGHHVRRTRRFELL